MNTGAVYSITVLSLNLVNLIYFHKNSIFNIPGN